MKWHEVQGSVLMGKVQVTRPVVSHFTEYKIK